MPPPEQSIGASRHMSPPLESLEQLKFVQTSPMPQSMSVVQSSPIMPMPMPIGLPSGWQVKVWQVRPSPHSELSVQN